MDAKRIMIKPLEVPDELNPIAYIFTDGEGKFAFYAHDELIHFMALKQPRKRMELTRNMCNKLLLHIVQSATDLAKKLLASPEQCN